MTTCSLLLLSLAASKLRSQPLLRLFSSLPLFTWPPTVRRFVAMSETQTAGGGSWPALETLDVALTVVGVALNAALGQSLVLRTDPFLACFPGGGASYGAHLDGGGQVSGCKLTTIVYANSGWVAEAGGELHMLDERAREWRSVPPIAGRVVIFHSESILHRVQPSYAHFITIVRGV